MLPSKLKPFFPRLTSLISDFAKATQLFSLNPLRSLLIMCVEMHSLSLLSITPSCTVFLQSDFNIEVMDDHDPDQDFFVITLIKGNCFPPTIKFYRIHWIYFTPIVLVSTTFLNFSLLDAYQWLYLCISRWLFKKWEATHLICWGLNNLLSAVRLSMN